MANDPRILLVEDDRDDIELAMLAFEQQALADEVHVVRSGEDALSYLHRCQDEEVADRAQLPAVVLLDINLPGLTGLQVLEQLRANDATRHLPVVILTSSGRSEDLERSYGLGANSFVRKSLDFRRFQEAIALIEQYWLTLNRTPHQRGPREY